MGTYHENWAIEGLKSLDDNQRADIAQIQILLMREHWGELQDLVFQDYAQRNCSIEDALAWGQFWEGMSKGRILYARVQVGTKPLPDKQKRQNEAALNKGIKRWKMKAEVLDGDSDGRVRWAEPLVVDQAWFDPDSDMKRYLTYLIPKGGCALEIGATKGSRTIFHLRGGVQGGVGRWPYKSEYMWILLPAQPYLEEAKLLQDVIETESGERIPISEFKQRLPQSLQDDALVVPEYGLFGNWFQELDEMLRERGINGLPSRTPDKSQPTNQPNPETTEDLYY